MAWNPTARGAFDTHALAGGARLLPRSDMALFSKVMSAVQRAPRHLTAEGRLVLMRLFVQIYKAMDRGDGIPGFPRLVLVVRVGYALHHPRTHLDPVLFVDPSTGAPQTREVTTTSGLRTIEVPAFVAVPPDIDASAPLTERTTCVRNFSGNACFTDTPFVVMFVATDAFDPLFRAARSPARFHKPDREEVQAMGARAETTMYDWCREFQRTGDDPVGTPAARERVTRIGDDLTALARAIGWNMRMPGREDVNYVGIFRDVLADCVAESAFMRTGQDDAGVVYDALISLTGWGDWHMSTIVEEEIITHVGDAPLSPPYVRFFKLANPLLSRRIKFLQPTHTSNTVLFQGLVDAVSAKTALVDTVRYVAGVDTELQQIEEHMHHTNQPPTVRYSRGDHIDIRYKAVQHIVRLPSADVMVFDAADLRATFFVPGMSQAPEWRILIPNDRIFTVEHGWPNKKSTAHYKIFAIIVYQGADARGGGGHYVAYFWHGSRTYYYNDLRSPTLSIIPPEEPLPEEVKTQGRIYFARRIQRRAFGPPPGTP